MNLPRMSILGQHRHLVVLVGKIRSNNLAYLPIFRYKGQKTIYATHPPTYHKDAESAKNLDSVHHPHIFKNPLAYAIILTGKRGGKQP